MNNVLSQSYLMGLYNTPSSELPTSELAARINADCGTKLTDAQVRQVFNVQLNSPLKNRSRKAVGTVSIVMDLDNPELNVVGTVDAATDVDVDVETEEVADPIVWSNNHVEAEAGV